MSRHRRSRSIALALLLFGAGSCSSDGSTTDPSVQQEETIAVISGPDQVARGCFSGSEAVFNASQSSGPINAFAWMVDGEAAGAGNQLRYTFREIRDYSVTLNGLNTSGSVVASDHKTVTVTPPANLADCLNQTRITGREGVLLRTGQASVTTEYSVNTAEIAEGTVESYTWILTPEGGTPETVAQGADAQIVEVNFDAGGTYELVVAQMANGTTFTTALSIKVYTGDPVSESGTIVFVNNGDSGFGGGGRGEKAGIYLMDGETGHVSGPILEEGDGVYHVAGGGLACYGNRVVFTGNADPGDSKTDLWEINLDGTGLREVVDAVGILQGPDISPQGDVAVVDDSRWDFVRDELAIHFSDGVFSHVSGATTDSTFNGFDPSWSPDGTRVALGQSEGALYDSGARGIAFYQVNRTTHQATRSTIRIPSFPHLQEDEQVFMEAYPAWDPRGDFIAYHVNVFDTLSMDPETSSYDTRYLLALWRIGTAEIQVLREDQQTALKWSPNGDYLLFHRFDDENEFHPGIWQVPRGGGEPVNLSAITQDGAVDWLGGFCKDGD